MVGGDGWPCSDVEGVAVEWFGKQVELGMGGWPSVEMR